MSRWDALGPSVEKVKDEDDTTGIKTEKDDEEFNEGRVWRLQAHARNSITAIKVDPTNGSGVSPPWLCLVSRCSVADHGSSSLHRRTTVRCVISISPN